MKRLSSRSARIACALGALWVGAAHAEFVRVSVANSVGNSVYTVTSFGAPNCKNNCGTISTLNTDGASHGSYDAVALVTNAATGTVDTLVADVTKGQIIRYTPAYKDSQNVTQAACTTVVWPTSGSNGTGPTKPDGLSVDGNNNLYVVTNKKPSLWVLQAANNTYACGSNGGYAANPLLIDSNSFFALGDVVLQDTAVASDTTAAWAPGDLLVLTGSKTNANSAELTVYRQATIQAILAGGAAAAGPDATLIPPSTFPGSEFPVGFDFWPSTTAGGHTTVVVATTAGRVLQFDFTAGGIAAGYPTVFASALGSGLQKIKVGLYLEVPYAFLTSKTSTGAVLQLGAPVNGNTQVIGVANTGVNAPDGIVVGRAAAVSAVSCSNPGVPAGSPNPVSCDIGGKGVVPHSIFNYSQVVSGNIVEQSCVVLSDPRWLGPNSCNGQPLDISTLCPGFGHQSIPATLCGGSGIFQSGFAVVQASAPGVDGLGGIAVYSDANADNILPANPNGAPNPTCPNALIAWAPRAELSEGTVLKVVGNAPTSVDEFVESTGWCDGPGGMSRGASVLGVGLVFDLLQIGTMQSLVQQKFLDLQATVNYANTGTASSTLSADLQQLNSYLQQTDWPCAAASAVRMDSDVNGFEAQAGGSPSPWAPLPNNLNYTNPNPWGEIRGRLANIFLTVNSRIQTNTPNATWPTAAPNCPAPAVTVTLSNPNPVAQGTQVTVNWSAQHATSCTALGGSTGDGWPTAGTALAGVSGSIPVTPSTTTTYNVQCKGLNGTSQASPAPQVVVVPPPTASNFSATPNPATVGQTVKFTWSASGASSCTVSGGGWSSGAVTTGTATTPALASAGQITYTLNCVNSVGTPLTTALTVQVNVVQPVTITSFTASPSVIAADHDGDADDYSTLTWKSANATSCSLTGGGLNLANQPTSGSLQVSPNSTSTYTLTCLNGAGGNAKKAVTVTVKKDD
jgi:hypothetical protein